ncbi:hypothetical protein [Paractinoplanes atraurantiacus]|uniref:Uncharacterized protein n=1 Tax=Paractinoplanes atraurantiacus TaxID=1036182 RepID=A0A285JI54_9ACTN|nr:hypothetical protein [Actinoplanes atraurantiacus]SNY59056.1 hypothetical protein SAMN05421748_12017 [Actinoplanes atraurantiacus]
MLEDVLNIEINVISKPGMTGRKMPESHFALLDIITEYNCELDREGVSEVVRADTFRGLALVAELPLKIPDKAKLVIRKRISRNCAAIERILRRDEVAAAVGTGIGFDAGPDVHLPLSMDEVLVVRKVWEVGVESIMIQTVAQLDGDIVTRLDPAHVSTTDSPVHTVHRASVETAYQYWRFLIETAVQFGGRLLSR